VRPIEAFIAAAYSSIDARDLLLASARSTLRPVVTQECKVQRAEAEAQAEDFRSTVAGKAVSRQCRGDPLVTRDAWAPRPPVTDEAERLRRHERDMRLAFRGLMA